MRVEKTPAFQRTLEEVIKDYHLSETEINKAVNDLSETWPSGDNCPGYGADIEVRKQRVPLKKYKLSKSNGLRLVTLVLKTAGMLVPLVIYKKGKFKQEPDAVAWTKKKLREILEHLQQK